ncbi:MAG: SAM-dependent methyltransferase [Rhodospirillum sp.]|nr:SAM-dependent methyltransferase [Rhodospirillum sp.]
MPSLNRDVRRELEKTINAARRVAVAGARKALDQLRVGEAEAPKRLTADQSTLRNRLRAHGRQLGDRRDPKTGAQHTGHLIQEVAYEHWHRMLFARFLAEVDLLIEPKSGVAISLDEVQELARETATNWLALASDYAERMLPQIFRKDDPVLGVTLPPETRSELDDLLKALPKAVFEADDSLGWVYQFWQSERKDEVNKSETKIGADELPAVTQLFTEDYMVLFLLHNTLGAWWAGKILAKNTTLATTAASEDALRAACKVGDIEWTYLRFIREKEADGSDGSWRPAAGAFDGWPKVAKEITVLDPCMGSGHFLVFALPMLVAFRMAEDSLGQAAAIEAVLRDNLFGLEIDPRCTQIAAFNLAFAAWRKIGFRVLPSLNLACSGLAIGVSKTEWLKLAERVVIAADPAAKRDLLGVETNLLTAGLEERVKNGLSVLYDIFAKAPWLGSLIDPRRTGTDIFHEGFEKLEPLLASILGAVDSDDAREMAVIAQGVTRAAELLSQRFTLVATNVPFLTKGKQSAIIREFIEEHHHPARADLATAMFSRALQLLAPGSTLAVVTPQNWYFLGAFTAFRHDLMKKNTLRFVLNLGPAAFDGMNWWALKTALTIVTSGSHPANTFSGLDLGNHRELAEKPRILCEASTVVLLQQMQLQNPDNRIIIGEFDNSSLLSTFARAYQGVSPADAPRFSAAFWEVADFSVWKFWQSTVDAPQYFGGKSKVIKLNHEFSEAVSTGSAFLRGVEAWNRRGIVVSQMGKLPVSLYGGEPFDTNCAVVIPNSDDDLGAIWEFCSSPEYNFAVRSIDQALKVTNASLVKVPFKKSRWSSEFNDKHPNGLPKLDTDDPTQWPFCGAPQRASNVLQVSTARLLGYLWPRQVGCSFMDCPSVGADGLEAYADTDGIVCYSALKGEPPAEQRLNALLADIFGTEWSPGNLAGQLAKMGFSGKALGDWLRDGFFAQHCELFHQRPFIWHIWDGRRDGFHALVNYHRLAATGGEGRRTLEKLIYSYLGDWIDRQRADQGAGAEGADARLAHAEHLRAELIKILEGERPYDIFVRWKPLHEQPIGWAPDINDGVRVNIRPFMTARTLNARGSNSCILRTTPKIKWDKDRGKEPTRNKADYPWFWSWDESTPDFVGGATFDGNRWNDLHYSRAAKQAARERRIHR